MIVEGFKCTLTAEERKKEKKEEKKEKANCASLVLAVGFMSVYSNCMSEIPIMGV